MMEQPENEKTGTIHQKSASRLLIRRALGNNKRQHGKKEKRGRIALTRYSSRG